MGNLSSSPFPPKQSIKRKVPKPEVGGDGDAPTVAVDITEEQKNDFLARINELKKQIQEAQKAGAPSVTGGKTSQRKLRIKFA